MGMTDDRVVLASDYPALETLAKSVVKEKQKFERLEVTKEQLKEMFAVSRSPVDGLATDTALTVQSIQSSFH